MICFVIRVLVTALALAITVILTPGLAIQPLLPGVIDSSATYLLIGILFGLINAFIRPLVLLFTARLLVRNMALFAIAINAFLFWLLALVVPGAFAIESPQLLWIILAGVIVAMVLGVMEALIGLDMPALGSQIERQFYWRWVGLLAENMAQFEAIHIPAVYWDLSSRKVLTVEFLSGVKINDVKRIEAAGLDRAKLAREFVRAMTKQTLFDSFFHADPHPGNALVDLESGRIGFLDMGLMGELNRMQRMALADLLVSMVEKDGYSLGKAALRLSRPRPGATVDEAAFLDGMERFGQRFLGVAESMS